MYGFFIIFMYFSSEYAIILLRKQSESVRPPPSHVKVTFTWILLSLKMSKAYVVAKSGNYGTYMGKVRLIWCKTWICIYYHKLGICLKIQLKLWQCYHNNILWTRSSWCPNNLVLVKLGQGGLYINCISQTRNRAVIYQSNLVATIIFNI